MAFLLAAAWLIKTNTLPEGYSASPHPAGAQARRVYKRVGRKTAKFRLRAAAGGGAQASQISSRAGFVCQAPSRALP